MNDSSPGALAARLLKSYEDDGAINLDGPATLPSRDAVSSIMRDLLRLMFPGFYDSEPVTRSVLRLNTEQLVASLSTRLAVQIDRAFHGVSRADQTAHDAAARFLEELPAVRTMLALDVTAAFEGDPAARSRDEVLLAYPGVTAVSVQRLAHVLFRQGVPILPRMMTEWAHAHTGIDIHPGATIGASFFIDHGTGVVIGETTIIGARVKIYQGVTLGAKSFPKDANGNPIKGIKRHPNVGDDVTLYAGATVLGNITIGDRSVVGSNVWLLESVPPGSLVSQPSASAIVKSSHPGTA